MEAEVEWKWTPRSEMEAQVTPTLPGTAMQSWVLHWSEGSVVEFRDTL